MADIFEIAGRIHSTSQEGVATVASEILDETQNKKQNTINADVVRHENEIHGTGGIDSRLTDVEQMEQIVIDGGDAQIATGADFTNPDATKRAKVPTVGAIVDGLNDGIYDVSKRNPTAGPNSDGKFTLDYILSNANTLIPTGWRHGGMTISFVDSSDNKYVQARFILSGSYTTLEFLTPSNWQGVDKIPTHNSINLPESGSTYRMIESKNDIYINIPDDGDGDGFWNNGVISATNPNWRNYLLNISNTLAGKVIRLRAGNTTSGFAYLCELKLSDNTIVSLNDSSYILEELNNYVLLKVPDNATELHISWDKMGINYVVPMLSYDTNDNKLYNDYSFGNVFPVLAENNGYYNDSLTIQSNPRFKCEHKVITNSLSGKVIRLRAGNTVSGFAYLCHVKLQDNSVIHLHNNNQYIIKKYSDYYLVSIPENATDLYLSWAFDGDAAIIPYLAYVYADEYKLTQKQLDDYNIDLVIDNITIPTYGDGSGFYNDSLTVQANPNWRYYLLEVPDNIKGQLVRLRAGNTASGFAYFCHVKLQDNSVIHLHNSDYIVDRLEEYYLVTIPNNAKELYLSWASSGDTAVTPMLALVVSDINYKIAELNERTSALENGNGTYVTSDKGFPVIPSHLFLLSDKSMPLYKNSLLPKVEGSANIIINLKDNTSRKIFTLSEPSYFGNNDLGNEAKVFLQGVDDETHLIYKNIKIFHKDTTALNGKTVKVMSLGDSLTQGLDWSNTPVTMLAEALENYGVTVQYVGSLVRTYTNNHNVSTQIRYEGRGAWRYRTFVGMESKFSSRNVVIPDGTKHEWVEGVDGTIDEIKANNAFLYPATAQDLNDNPDFCFHFVSGSTVENKSYTQDQSLGDYVIFDPVRYFSERQIDVPDILTIALGTNEWYLNQYGGFNNEKATACAEFMIKQFRKVSNSMKIVVIPMNNFPISRQSDWENYCIPLCSNIIKMCDALITAGDNNLFICPIYAQGARWLSYNGTVGSSSDVSSINDMKKIEIDTNVHVLYEKDDSNYDYREALTACVANLIS